MGQKQSELSITQFHESKTYSYQRINEKISCLKLRIPYLWEQWTGQNMNWYYANQVPYNLISNDMRTWAKAGDLPSIKQKIFTGMWMLDDPLDIFSKHTLLHDAVIFGREDMVDFLMVQGANPMVRDQNGYTPLLKAAALGKTKIVKTLVEEYLVDPRHTDPYGNTAREKAELYSHDGLAAYLLQMEDKATKGEFKAAKHDKFQRSGTNRCAYDY